MLANYKKSRDTAWELLIRHRIRSLPVDIVSVCKREGLRLFPYSDNMDKIKRLGLMEHTRGNDAFSVAGMIFYNDSTNEGRMRFSIAHELGHMVLHADRVTVYNREPSDTDDPKEIEANMFAARLLAPAIVLERMDARSPEEIAETCNISQQAAGWRFRRLQLLRERDRTFKAQRGYSCFGLSPLERRVEKLFGKYVAKRKVSRRE